MKRLLGDLYHLLLVPLIAVAVVAALGWGIWWRYFDGPSALSVYHRAVGKIDDRLVGLWEIDPESIDSTSPNPKANVVYEGAWGRYSKEHAISLKTIDTKFEFTAGGKFYWLVGTKVTAKSDWYATSRGKAETVIQLIGDKGAVPKRLVFLSEDLFVFDFSQNQPDSVYEIVFRRVR